MALTKIPYSMVKDSMISVVDYGAALTGTTGTDGLLTFGLTSVPQNLYVQNRLGSQRILKIRVS